MPCVGLSSIRYVLTKLWPIVGYVSYIAGKFPRIHLIGINGRSRVTTQSITLTFM